MVNKIENPFEDPAYNRGQYEADKKLIARGINPYKPELNIGADGLIYWNSRRKDLGERVIENSGNYSTNGPESSRIPQEFLSAVKNTNVFEVSKGQFGEGSDTINRIVHIREENTGKINMEESRNYEKRERKPFISYGEAEGIVGGFDRNKNYLKSLIAKYCGADLADSLDYRGLLKEAYKIRGIAKRILKGREISVDEATFAVRRFLAGDKEY